nr:uncharacterized protein LOC117606412 [Osmia lignaria]
MLKLLLFLMLINAIEYHAYTQENYVLNAALKHTSNVFKKLKLNEGTEDLNENVILRINQTVVEHVRNTSKIILSRRKRELSEDFNKGINTLNGFKDFIQLNFRNVRDVNIFSLKNGYEVIWFAAILDGFGVSLLQINKDSLFHVTAYPVTNGTRLIVNECNYGTLLIIQNQDNSIHVLRLSKVNDKYYLHLIQDLESNDISHLTIWNGMNQLHLGISSQSSTSIFTWFGDYFDLVQVINLNTKKLVPFQNKGFMYLAATGSVTLIFKHFLKSDEFLVIQKLPASKDASFFQLREGHFTDNYLSLSTESSVVIYKDIHGRFVPFQQIPSGKPTVPIVSNKAILFFTLQEDTLLTYQYNGWRFIELDVKLHGVHRLQTVNLYGKQLLLMKYKNDTWTLKQLIWTKRKTYKDIQEEIKAWNIKAKNIAQRQLNEISNLNNSVQILNGHIDQLFVHNVNQHNSKALKNVSVQYNKVSSKLQEQSSVINNKWHSGNVTVTSLSAKKIQMRCKTTCRINKVNIKGNTDLLLKLKVLPNKNEVSSFKTLKVKEIKNWKCPIFNLLIDNIVVSKSINGMLLENLHKNTLKITGNQTILGRHSFISINVTNTVMPLNIASYFAKKEIQAKKVKVKELTLTEGGILLPLNGSSTVITGSISASRITVKDKIRLQGSVTGSWAKNFSPIKYIPDSISIYHDVNIENARIENLQSTDLINNKTGSVKDILSNAITLHENVPVSLVFSSQKTKWNNITIHGPQNWVTANSQNVITGKKHMLHNVEITKFSYENLRFPRIETALCGASIIVPEIKATVLTVNNVTVKSLTSPHVFGNLADKSGFIFKPLNSSAERYYYYYNVKAKNIFTSHTSNINLTSKALERFTNSWVEPNILKSSIEATDLTINVLQSSMKFYPKWSRVIRNVVSKKNIYVGNINKINFTDFLVKAIKLEDIISLRNVTFNNGFTTNHIHISYPLLPLIQTDKDLILHKKRISGNIEVNVINLPYLFGLEKNHTSANIIIKGSAIFPTEPNIHNINKNNLKDLFMRTWIITTATTFVGKNLHVTDVVLKGNITINNSTNILYREAWKNISERVLSKTKVQTIIVDASLNTVETSSIVGSNTSTIVSSVSDFNYMFNNSLMKGRAQDVKAKWTFDKLIILGKMNARKKINNMNLKTDVMRYDSRRNIVTGKKTVLILTTKNLNGLNFAEWADSALIPKENRVIIKGQKHFLTAAFNDITLSGTIMGHSVDEALLQFRNQTIHGQKIIHGSIRVSRIFIDGLVNDVNLTNLIDHQLKKQSSLQKIETTIELQKKLIITGNLIVNDTYGGANMKNFEKSYSYIPFITDKSNNYSKIAETINLALRNHANYIHKLEIVKNITSISRQGTIMQREQCKVRNFSKYCVSEHIENIVFRSDTKNSILIKSIFLEETEFVVWIKFHFVSIYKYNNVNKNLIRVKDLHIPRIIDAFVEQMFNSLWIILRLTSQTLVLHYQPWQELQEYVLPATDVFALSRSPNNQLLLFLSSGVWNLKGLASPQNIIEIPLKGQVQTFVNGFDYFVKYTSSNNTILTKVRYVGNC